MKSEVKKHLYRALRWVLYAPIAVFGAAIIGFLLFAFSSFVYQYFDKFFIPSYAKPLPERVRANQSWLDSIRDYNVDYRINFKRPQGIVNLKYSVNPKCNSANSIRFLLDSNFVLIENSVELSDSKHGFVINDSLFGCDTSEVAIFDGEIWKRRIKFLRDTLKVSAIRTTYEAPSFQLGSDLALKRNQKIDYQCYDGIMYHELMIDEEWKILRNCITF